MRHVLLCIFLAGSLMSCTFEVPVKPGSNGKTCEIAVVCDRQYFGGAVGDTLRAFFMQESDALNQSEPLFSLANITNSAFHNSDMFKRLRNTIIVNISDTTTELPFVILKDPWATNQTVFIFNVATQQEFMSVFNDKQNLMLGAFYANERERIKRIFQTTENTNISTTLREKFGFKMIVPEGFLIGVNKQDVLCLTKDAKDYSQTIIVTRYPYLAESFTQTDILAHRNSLGKRYVQGSIDSSYMTTEMRVPLQSKEINFHGAYAIETKGLWRMVGDFMGGPFQNYVFVDGKNMVMIDVFLYSPRKPKRDLMMQLEGIVFSLSHTEETTDSISAASKNIHTK